MELLSKILLIIFLLAFGVVALVARVFIPYWVAKQLATKDRRLAVLLSRIPVFRVSRKAEAVEKLMKKPQNQKYLGSHYPEAFRWYTLAHKWWWRGMVVFIALILFSQVVGVVRFAEDPQAWREGAKKSAERLFGRE